MRCATRPATTAATSRLFTIREFHRTAACSLRHINVGDLAIAFAIPLCFRVENPIAIGRKLRRGDTMIASESSTVIFLVPAKAHAVSSSNPTVNLFMWRL